MQFKSKKTQSKKAKQKKEALLLAGLLTLSAATGSAVYAQRPKTLHVTVDGTQIQVVTNAATLEEALEGAKVSGLEGAQSTLSLADPVQDHLTFAIQTKKNVALQDGATFRTVPTYVATVGDLLFELGIEPDEDDVITPARETKLQDGMKVSIDYYETTVEKTEEAIPFASHTEENADMEIGTTSVKVAGQNGVRSIETKVTKKNGEIISREELSNRVTKEPVDEVIYEGTYDPTPSSPMLYSLSDFHFQGVINYAGYTYTYYSQSVLPGGGLSIPGRHVNENGFVADGDGYIVLANSAPNGTVFPTPFGAYGKVYDSGTSGNHLDVYTQ